MRLNIFGEGYASVGQQENLPLDKDTLGYLVIALPVTHQGR